jgi:hypothetical protein
MPKTPPKPTDTTRLNCLIPSALHRRVKAACATEGISMTDIVVEFLEERFPAPKIPK